MEQFYKGRTNNHLSWVMVDSTDFATPESALSAAITWKVYGKVRGAAGVNFVQSGTGSTAGGDIVHVGASATGVYTAAFAKADLSDASQAWYDHYVIIFAGTGAAQQVFQVDGGIDLSAASAYQSRLSDILSAVLLAQSLASDAHSAAAQANSRILLVQSRLSDFNSAYASDISDILSGIAALSGLVSDAHSQAAVASSRILLVQSRVSDFQSIYASDMSDVRSMLTALSDAISNVDSAVNSQYSDLASKIGNVSVTITASDISDIASAVAAAVASVTSDAHSAAAQANSRILLVQSRLSDFQSAYNSDISDVKSALTVIGSQTSNINSATVASPDLSDIASAVLAEFSDALSDLRSQIAAVTATVTASDMSDIASRVEVVLASRLSDILSAAVQTNSRVILIQSRLSDFNSVYTSDISDLRSQIAALTVGVDASAISDIASAVQVALASDLSDLLSRTTQINSRALLIQSLASDAHSAAILAASHASDAHSAAAAGAESASILSDIYSLLSDLHSDVTVMSGVVSDIRSDISRGVNIRAINGTTVIGDGGATPWGP